jgi:solute carrier family 25 carnitine/acylcarnitine transporter 20/29
MAQPLSAPRLSIRAAAFGIYQSGGLRGFYAGIVPVALRAFPVNACAYFVYEGLMRGLGAEKVR